MEKQKTRKELNGEKRVTFTIRIKQSNKSKIVRKGKANGETPSRMGEILLEKALALSEI
jgi:hypothetical protein